MASSLTKNNLRSEIIDYSKKIQRAFLIGEVSLETRWSLEVCEWCLELLVDEGILKKLNNQIPLYILQKAEHPVN